MTQIPSSSITFLKDLKKNNNRDWFTEHKKRYQKEHEQIISFADALLLKMNEHDVIETPSGKKSLFRIYRDVRFSKDKSPYKTHWAGGFTRATKARRGGYYFHIQPEGQSFIGGGFWAPNKEDLLRIREEIATDASELRDILADPVFISTFGELQGEQLKTAPKGFPKDHPDIDLLRYKQFIFSKNFSDEEVLAPDFLDRVNDTFKAMRPFFDFMSEVLTTDSNGESIL
ncbi:MAG: DUF2461 domain-containing protein [Flavobacteriales bacterium]|nr:DUF2461 domain-containing protein [Flavobacteriales bacterium]